jgi:hypothetical protein
VLVFPILTLASCAKVGPGGFLLASGQGWFLRGWGCTSDQWVKVMKIEENYLLKQMYTTFDLALCGVHVGKQYQNMIR